MPTIAGRHRPTLGGASIVLATSVLLAAVSSATAVSLNQQSDPVLRPETPTTEVWTVNASPAANVTPAVPDPDSALAAVPSDAPEAFVPGRVLVKFTAQAGPEEVEHLLRTVGAEYYGSIPFLDIHVVTTTPGSEADVALSLESSPLVVFAERDAVARADLTPNDPDYNDPNLVYGPQRVAAPDAWEHTLGDPDIIVAIIDTGVSVGHEDLVGRAVSGWDFANDDSDPADDNGHGTHVAGIAAATTNNATGIAGMAQAGIMPVKVLNAGGAGSHSDIASGIAWAVDHGADVINLSLGGPISTLTLESAVIYAYNSGVPIVASAGNEDSSQPYFPAAYPQCVGVSATTASDERWPLSNHGSFVDLSAPGASIWSTYWAAADPTTSYVAASGTSQSAPFVTGTVALMLALEPWLTPANAAGMLAQGVDDLGAIGWDEYFGHGRLNADKAMHLVEAGTPVPSPTPTNTPTPTATPYAQRVNAGGPTYVDGTSTVWAADQEWAGDWGYTGGRPKASTSPVSGTDDDPLYQRYRADPHEYRFAVPDGTYDVTLRFAEFVVSRPEDRTMRITIEGQQVESALSIFALVGQNAALDRTYAATVTDGILNVSFAKNGGKKKPVVSAVDVRAR